MSIALTHFLVGATIFIWLTTFGRECDDHDGLVWALMGGIWAMIPDLAKFWPEFQPVHDQFIISSTFGLHGLLDVADPTDSLYVALLAIIVFGATVVLTNVHDLR